jgi:hypothetical protein
MSSGQGRLLENPSLIHHVLYSRYERGQRTSSDGRRHGPRIPDLDSSDRTPDLNPAYHTGMSGVRTRCSDRRKRQKPMKARQEHSRLS